MTYSKELQADFWDQGYGYGCITTNGYVTNDGLAVMGRGIAKQAAEKFTDIRRVLGYLIRSRGNHVHVLPFKWHDYDDVMVLVSFPVKHVWNEKADLELIKRSCSELMEMLPKNEYVFLPRPGCGNGQLDWETQVKPVCQKYLDQRVTILYQ